MSHPFKSVLDEYQIAIDHLGPTVPVEIKQEAQRMHDDLLRNKNVDEDKILVDMSKTGREEYPYRHAFNEVVGVISKKKQQKIVIEQVDNHVRQKLEKYLETGETLEELVASKFFETEFNADERFQIEHNIQETIDRDKEDLKKTAEEVLTSPMYQKALEKWQKEIKEIEEKIKELELLKEKEAKWKDEIENKVKRFRGGFLVTERDPGLLEIKKEIEYWRGTLGEDI